MPRKLYGSRWVVLFFKCINTKINNVFYRLLFKLIKVAPERNALVLKIKKQFRVRQLTGVSSKRANQQTSLAAPARPHARPAPGVRFSRPTSGAFVSGQKTARRRARIPRALLPTTTLSRALSRGARRPPGAEAPVFSSPPADDPPRRRRTDGEADAVLAHRRAEL